LWAAKHTHGNSMRQGAAE